VTGCDLRRAEYVDAIRPLALLVVLSAVLAAVAAACGSSGESSTGAAPATSATTTSAATTTTAETTTTPVDTLAGAGTTPVEAAATGSETALLDRVGVAGHEGYDRVVFQFTNVVPGYRIEYRPGPFSEDGSGRPVSLNGHAFVVVRMEPASGYDLNAGEGQLVYKGSPRIEGKDSGTSMVAEVVRTGDFESVLTWVVGLGAKVDFRVRTLSAPARLVVDFRDH